MAFWNKIGIGKVDKEKTRSFSDDVLKDAIREIGGFSASGVPVTSESALKFSAVWSAVRLLSEIPASLPKSIISQDANGSFTTLDTDPVNTLLEFPSTYMTGFDFHELMNASLHLRGNAIALIICDRRGVPVELIPINWSCVKVRIWNGKLIYHINDPLFNIYGDYYASDVLHYKLFSRDGIIGRSPIQMAKDNLGLAISAENYGGEFFRKGGNHKGVIETTSSFKNYEEYKRWREKYDAEHTGTDSNHGIAILQPGMTYKQLTMSMEDAQFIATRQFQISDVARWFNLPPHLIGDLSRATFTNIEHQDLQFIKYTLRGVIKRQEKEWEYKLFSPERRNKVDVKFNIDGLARGDMAARSGYIVQMVNAGIISPNEGRIMEFLAPKDGHDELRIPQNITGAPQAVPKK